MLYATSLQEFGQKAKSVLSLIREGIKLVGKWTWQLLTNYFNLFCNSAYELVSGWAKSVDDVIQAACKRKGCPRERLPPSFKDKLDQLLTETREFLSNQFESLKEFFCDVGRGLKYCAEDILSKEFMIPSNITNMLVNGVTGLVCQRMEDYVDEDSD